MRILLVEDGDHIAKPLAEDLRHQHHLVDLAYDGIEGWNCFQSVIYDVKVRFSGGRQLFQLHQQLSAVHCNRIVMLRCLNSYTQKPERNGQVLLHLIFS